MDSIKLEDVVKMALYHPENHIRCKVRNHLKIFPYTILSCFEYDSGVYMSIEEEGHRKDVRICNAPKKYFGVNPAEAHPFIVTIDK